MNRRSLFRFLAIAPFAAPAAVLAARTAPASAAWDVAGPLKPGTFHRLLKESELREFSCVWVINPNLDRELERL